MDYLGTLNRLASTFKVSPVGIGSGLEPTLKIDPPPEVLDPNGLALSGTVQKVAQVDEPLKIDLTFLGKWVRSVTSNLPPDPATEDPIGGMPVVDQLVALVGLTTNLPPASQMTSDPGQGAVPGVPEVLGRITGTITQTVEKLTNVVQRLTITLGVRWRVLDESTPGVSSPASSVQYRTAPTAGWQPPTPATFPNPLELPAGGAPTAGTPMLLLLKFPAMFSELTSGAPDVMTFSVRASIKLSLTPPTPPAAPAIETAWVDLPPLPLVVPTIPVPTILVLCEHPNFAGRKLVLVPSNSLLGVASGSGGIGIGTALNLTNAALQSFASANALIGFLAASLGGSADTAANVLKALAPSPGQTKIAAHSQVNDLSAYEFVFDPGGLFGVGRFTGDNMASSIICIGRPDTTFDLFQEPNLNERITRLQIKLDGFLGCAIRKLDQLDPTPDVVYGAGITSSSPGSKNEDRISSLSFTGPPVRFLPVPTSP